MRFSPAHSFLLFGSLSLLLFSRSFSEIKTKNSCRQLPKSCGSFLLPPPTAICDVFDRFSPLPLLNFHLPETSSSVKPFNPHSGSFLGCLLLISFSFFRIFFHPRHIPILFMASTLGGVPAYPFLIPPLLLPPTMASMSEFFSRYRIRYCGPGCLSERLAVDSFLFLSDSLSVRILYRFSDGPPTPQRAPFPR